MNSGFTYTLESLFGPASELIDITNFLTSAAHVRETAGEEPETSAIAEECR